LNAAAEQTQKDPNEEDDFESCIMFESASDKIYEKEILCAEDVI
jgi:hypothetical protein